MRESNTIKRLDNYQLYQLLQNKLLDKDFLNRLEIEFRSRKLSENEKSKLRDKYELCHSEFSTAIEENNWNPLFTAFALNKHFRHLALLKTQGKKKEAEKYMIQLYFGLALYFSVIIFIILIMKTK